MVSGRHVALHDHCCGLPVSAVNRNGGYQSGFDCDCSFLFRGGMSLLFLFCFSSSVFAFYCHTCLDHKKKKKKTCRLPPLNLIQASSIGWKTCSSRVRGGWGRGETVVNRLRDGGVRA